MTDYSQKFGIYIHWPFCLSKCPYCDFFSQVKNNVSQEDIIKGYISDLDFYHSMTSDKIVTSIFFGGGTPSLIEPANIEKLILHIKNKWKCIDNIEISLEANPNTNHNNMFSELKKSGINRLSLGVQAINDTDLKFLGRTHNTKEAFLAIDEVIKTFDNHSMDMIYALPHQENLQWIKDLNIITGFGFKHLSLYQLTIEENTMFFKNNIKSMDDDKAADLYELTSSILSDKGYNNYEISNFAQNGYESKHNLLYWQGDDYIGVGKSSHGRIGLLATTHKRNIEKLSKEERAEELVIMGLRLKNGINKEKFYNMTNIKIFDFLNNKKIEELSSYGLLIDSEDAIMISTKGRNLTNFIIRELL